VANVDDEIAEIEQAQKDIALQHEGLRDFTRLNIQPSTLAEVNIVLAEYDDRVAKLDTALQTLTVAKQQLADLDADGHPEFPPMREVAEAVFNDLKDQEESIAAALARFKGTERAVELGLKDEGAEPK
jgi:uncharacterized coiled-coil protein SlyX